VALSGSLGKCRRKQVGQLPLFGSAVPIPVVTWDQAVDRWLIEQAHKASIESDRSNFRWLNQHLSGRLLHSIDRPSIDVLVTAKRAAGVANSTVNRALALLRSVLIKSEHDWGWLAQAPKIRLLPEPRRRIRFLTSGQASRLLTELPYHLSSMAAFTLATGLRRANVTGLQWSQVDIDRRLAWVHPDEAKGRRAIAVPLNDDALRILREHQGRHPSYVFTYKGKRVIQVSTAAWYKALHRAGIDNFRWHDLRHTWASWHVQNGTPLFALQELGGWESAEMVRKYAHLSASHLAVYADKLALHSVG
jgi:integrase